MPFKRKIETPTRSFFLFGPRGVGKSTWLIENLKEIPRLDLLDSRLYLELQRHPEKLEALLSPLIKNGWAIIDEIQKIPQLLNEVHRLIEKNKWKFALSGSSARKLKRGAANLLGGRAVTEQMEGFVSAELKNKFVLDRALEWGGLPLVVNEPKSSAELLDSYIHTYLKEEIREEGLIRRIDPFTRFLEIAGLMNGQILNLQNISRDAQVPRSSLDVYFQILEETLIGHFLPPYHPGSRVREVSHPKFYFFDPGVARAAAGLTYEPIDSVWKGFALETWIFHELRVYNSVKKKGRKFYFYKTGAGAEIDFVIETKKKTLSAPAEVITLEVKLSKNWDRRWEKPSSAFSEEKKIKVKSRWGVYSGDKTYNYDGFHILPIQNFLDLLWAGKVF